jgi:diguanylate cyclase (GGDEF)-like protein
MGSAAERRRVPAPERGTSFRADRRTRIERERLIVRLRSFALAFNVIEAAVAAGDSVVLTWVLVGVLALDLAITAGLLRRDAERLHGRAGWVGMVLDTVVVGLILANNRHDVADPIYLIVIFLALEAAVRWGRRGGVAGGAVSGLIASVWAWDVIVRHGLGRAEHLTLRFCTMLIVGSVSGGLVRRLDEERSRLAGLAYTDTLTGLANRPSLQEEVGAALDSGEAVALVFADLDGFKAVNDELGHTAGDAVLTEVARRMRSIVRTDDVVGRLGGDEFVVLVHGEATTTVHDLARRLAAAVEQPIEVRGRLVRVGASYGAVLARRGDGVDELMRRADDAMYRAKRSRSELVPELAGGEQPLPELVHDHALVGGVEAVAGEADAEEEDRGVEDAPERLLGP